MEKTIWMLEGFCDQLELDLARRIGEIEAARHCMGIRLSLSELRELKHNLDKVDKLDMDCPGHRKNWRPYPEV